MALFEPRSTSESEEIIGSDAATRALSVTVVENDFVARVYEKLASVYDFTFGPTLHPGRVDAIRRMGIKPGDRVLEVGVGPGINADLYPRDCSVTGIDLSSSMLEKARDRVARKDVRNVRLLQMDAANLKFADDSFDIVYAPYVISVVSDPVGVARDMRRVCRPGGRIVILNHFRSQQRLMGWLEDRVAPVCRWLGWKSNLALRPLLDRVGLSPEIMVKVNMFHGWRLVKCINRK